jgi:hypothetical protein
LTDYEYDMSMPTLYNYLLIALLIKLLRCILRQHWYVQYKWSWAYYINCVLWLNMCVIWGLWIHWFRNPSATIPNGSVTIGRMSLVSVGHSRSDSIVPLMLRTICCTMAEALVLYYRSPKTTPTLLGRGNISGRPCMRVMT